MINKIKLKIKNSLELSRKGKKIKINDNNFKELIKELNSYVDEYPNNKELIKSNVADTIHYYKTERKIKVGVGRRDDLINTLEFNIDNPNYVRKT
jgi:predicted RNase H-like nuclease (RuvC/YqgF family)|tara:strand:+ start:331 stop:615 length:285 start_codon:yes stop_codon:yes gene_type:complete